VTRLICPFCGPRELAEFVFHKTLAPANAASLEKVYERVGQLEDSVEHWQHVGGCRAWLRVRRNPSSGEVHEVSLCEGAAS